MRISVEVIVKQIEFAAAEAFNGVLFEKMKPTPEFEDYGIVSGSQRHLSVFDESGYGHVDVTEQYLLWRSPDRDVTTPKHYLHIAWADYDSIATVNLDEGTIDDVDNTFEPVLKPIALARHLLHLVGIVKPEFGPKDSGESVIQFEQMLNDDYNFGEIVNAIGLAMAADDPAINRRAAVLVAGYSFRADVFDRFAEQIRKKYRLSPAQVDEVIDMKMQQLQSSTFLKSDSES